MVMTISAIAAQDAAPEMPLTSAETLALLPDPGSCKLTIFDDGLTPQAVQNFGNLVIDNLGDDHFFGAVVAHRRADAAELSINVRAKLHSVAAAEAAAMSDCGNDRADGSSTCRVIGQIVPNEYDAEPSRTLSQCDVCADAGCQRPVRSKRCCTIARDGHLGRR
ncbi:hypothetical protein [Loktanella fryxellensis]|uniref:hypothetical protein n=1 Tax=Loktanella fryxellensis TaxID=245187 RepID=UPI001160061C|nr:hypothetical protein [Loktanella fryxellensis]